MMRSFSRSEYWDGIKRENYETLTGQKVVKVNLESGRATGVTFVPATAGNLTNISIVRARKEIVVAAGTIHTPQILQASGIGPKAVLEAAKIEVKVDLPGVGSNFQDHLIPGVSFNRNTALSPLSPLVAPLISPQSPSSTCFLSPQISSLTTPLVEQPAKSLRPTVPVP
jgi:choline dehydrogenase-like flavoprotein